MPNTPKLPEYAKERIYLQQNEDIEETTWCADMVGDDDIEYIRADVVAQELETLKAQVRKEIEGKLEAVGLCENTKKDSSWCNKCRECHLRGSDLNLGREEAFEDCLSIPSLKGEE